jgi:hypothetical protein
VSRSRPINYNGFQLIRGGGFGAVASACASRTRGWIEQAPVRTGEQHEPDCRAIRRPPRLRHRLPQSGFVHPITGRDAVANLLETVHAIFGRPTYRLCLSEGSDTALLFDGEVEGRTLQAMVVIRDDPRGLIQELTVLMRPLPVVRRFGEEAMATLRRTETGDIPTHGRPQDL